MILCSKVNVFNSCCYACCGNVSNANTEACINFTIAYCVDGQDIHTLFTLKTVFVLGQDLV